jgi:hypothetical protein
MTEGLFGMVILFIFEILPILEINNIDVSTLKWDIVTASYGSIFPTLLEYNSYFTDSDLVTSRVNLFSIRNMTPQYVLGDDFFALNKLFLKFFHIPVKFEKIIEQYNLSNFLGIHFRGTDKTVDTSMNNPVSVNEFYIILDSYLKFNSHINNIFLATDEAKVFSYLKSKYGHIHFLTSRNFEGDLYFRNNKDIASNGSEAMIDMLCLSKCDTVLKVSSALSAFSKVINPDLKIYRLNASRMFTDIPYFADAYIPLLEPCGNYSEECNAVLDKIQKEDWSKTHKQQFTNFYYKPR